jgi:hypothetical protein
MMATPITGIETPVFGPSTWDDLAVMAARLEVLGVPGFDTTGARDQLIESPVKWQCATVAGVLSIWSGSAWVAVSPGGGGVELDRQVAANDAATGTVHDTGGDLLVPVPVVLTAPTDSTTQLAAGTSSLRVVAQTLANNVKHVLGPVAGSGVSARFYKGPSDLVGAVPSFDYINAADLPVLPIDQLNAETRGYLDQPWSIVSADLNNIDGVASACGNYVRETATSTTALHYPADGLAGLLEVRAAPDGDPVFQTFTATTGRVWTRSRVGGVWSSWLEVSATAAPDPTPTLTQSVAACSYASGYSSYSSAYAALEVVKTGIQCTLNGGIISCSASFNAGSYYTYATLPTGYRPLAAHRAGAAWLYTAAGIITCQARVNTSGALEFATPAGTAPTGVSYLIAPSGISWRVAG